MYIKQIGISSDSLKNGKLEGPCGIKPDVGLNPTTPHQLAGFLKLPPRSDPEANQLIPVANAAAAPPELHGHGHEDHDGGGERRHARHLRPRAGLLLGTNRL